MTRDFDNKARETIDERLDQLITEAKQYPEQSKAIQRPLRMILNSVALRGRLFDRVIEESNPRKRAKAKQLFIWVMQQSGVIYVPRYCQNLEISDEDRADLEADHWEWFCRKFDRYVPEVASPATWFNRNLHFRVRDLCKKLYNQPISTDQPISSENGGSTIGDNLSSPDPDPTILIENEELREQVKACLQQPGFIHTCVSQDHLDIHCRSLLTDFLLDELTWPEIYQKHQVTQDRDMQSRIRSCYRQRCIPRLCNCLNMNL